MHPSFRVLERASDAERILRAVGIMSFYRRPLRGTCEGRRWNIFSVMQTWSLFAAVTTMPSAFLIGSTAVPLNDGSPV